MKQQPATGPNNTQTSTDDAAASGNEAQLIKALRDFELLRNQPGFDKTEFMARFPEIADELHDCLGSLEIAESVAAAAPLGNPGSLHPEFLDGYRLVRLIGRGGMGSVFEAVDLAHGQPVAIKVMEMPLAGQEQRLKRFQLEAHTAALLVHPNIVPILATGSQSNLHFCVMKLVNGCSLDVAIACLQPEVSEGANAGTIKDAVQDALQDSRDWLDMRERSCPSTTLEMAQFKMIVRLILQAADALEYSHQQGVVHRDIKPSNLLLDADGKLWLTDFGLARWIDAESLTVSGDMLGTLRYMSPEQMRGSRAETDQRTDIYSLGATLYEVLALQPFSAGESAAEILDTVRRAEHLPLRKLRPGVPRGLERIVAKSTASEVADRYQSAEEMADDLRRFLSDQPVRARPPGLMVRVTRFARSNPEKVLSLTCAMFLVMALLATVTTILYYQTAAKTQAFAEANSQRQLAENRATELLAARQEAEQNLRDAVTAVDDYFSIITTEEALQRGEFRELKTKLLASAIPFLEKLKQRNGGDSTELDLTAAHAKMRFGAILKEMRNHEMAVDELEQAAELFGDLHRRIPSDPQIVSSQLSCVVGVVDCRMKLGNFEQAKQYMVEAIKVQNRLVESYPCAALTADLIVADLKFQSAHLLYACREFDQALVECQSSIELADRLPGLEQFLPDEHPHRSDRLKLQGMIEYELGHQEQAVVCLQSAIDAYGERTSPAMRYRAAVAKSFLAFLLITEDPARALELSEASFETQWTIQQDEGIGIGTREDLVANHCVTLVSLISMGRTDDARRIQRKAGLISFGEERESKSNVPQLVWARDLYFQCQLAFAGNAN